MKACGKLDPRWKDGNQQDAHEYLRCILSTMQVNPSPLCMTDTVIAASCSLACVDLLLHQSFSRVFKDAEASAVHPDLLNSCKLALCNLGWDCITQWSKLCCAG